MKVLKIVFNVTMFCFCCFMQFKFPSTLINKKFYVCFTNKNVEIMLVDCNTK